MSDLKVDQRLQDNKKLSKKKHFCIYLSELRSSIEFLSYSTEKNCNKSVSLFRVERGMSVFLMQRERERERD